MTSLLSVDGTIGTNNA